MKVLPFPAKIYHSIEIFTRATPGTSLCIKSASFIDNCNSLSIGMAVDSFYISTLRIKRCTDHTRKQPVKNPEQKGWIGWIYVGWMIWHIAIIAWEEEKLILSRTANRFFLRVPFFHHSII